MCVCVWGGGGGVDYPALEDKTKKANEAGNDCQLCSFPY